MNKILSVKKISKGSINLDESVMDYLFLNEGDHVAFVEENNKIYIRKTRKPQGTEDNKESTEEPPPTFEEKSAEFSGIPDITGSNIFSAVQDALKNPETMKMFQDTAKQLFSALGDLGKVNDQSKSKKKVDNDIKDEDIDDDNESDDDTDYDSDDDSNDDSDDEEGFKVNID